MANLIAVLEQLKTRFDQREKEYMQVHKGRFCLQFKDPETGEIQMHELDYTSKDAQEIVVS